MFLNPKIRSEISLPFMFPKATITCFSEHNNVSEIFIFNKLVKLHHLIYLLSFRLQGKVKSYHNIFLQRGYNVKIENS